MKEYFWRGEKIENTYLHTCAFVALFAISFGAFFSCSQKSIKNTDTLLQGTYKGEFIRSSPLAKYKSSNVTVVFTENKFSGDSDQQNYPAICNGTFKVTGTEIEFVNECMWTADFEWSYILKDKFTLRIDGDKVELIKSVGDNTDHYTLTLQKL